ncbi:MAG TPA: hypothetical protein VHC22_28205 [Pirellulales bacterium]|nr:hypothetical protein [Pirellulales bacterium]
MRNELPAELDPARVTVVCDPREQTPWDLSPLRMERRALQTGDYAVDGAEHLCRLERKSLADFISCCTWERPRFTSDLQKLLAFPTRIVVVEASLAELSAGEWERRVSVQSVLGSIASWSAMGINFLFAGDRAAAQKMASRILYMVAKRQYNAARRLLGERRPRHVAEDRQDDGGLAPRADSAISPTGPDTTRRPARGVYPQETLAAFDPTAEVVG